MAATLVCATEERPMRRILCALVLGFAAAGTACAEDLGDLKARFKREKGRPYAARMDTVKAIAALATDEAARFLLQVIDDDEDQSIRLNTIHQVAKMPQRLVFERLLRHVRSRDSSLRSTAFHAIAYNRKEALPEDLIKSILAGTDQNMRSNLLRYFARRADPRFVPEVERFLADFPKGATSLTSILVQAKTPAAARILVRIYDDTRKYDRDQVSGMFVAAEPKVRGVLLDVLAGGKRRLVLRAAVLCRRAQVKEAEPALVAAIPKQDTELHAALIEALGAIGASTVPARAAILASLVARSPEVQAAGARALRGAPFPEAVPALANLLESTKDRLVAAETAVTLERITGQQYGDRADLWRRWWATHGRDFDFTKVKPAAGGAVPQVLVDLAIERGAAALKALRQDKPPWLYASHGQGTTALVVLALHAAGFKRRDKAVKAGVSYLLKAPVPDKTYDIGLVAMALEAVGGKRHKRRITECARALMASQNKAGLWGYPSGNGDNSNTQYAVLGLRAAARAGVKIPKRVWTGVRDHFYAAVGKDGGWTYPIRNPAHSSASMTASGVCCLLICLERLTLDDEEGRTLQSAIEKGYAALGALMKLDKDSLYTLYGIERAGVLGGRSSMGGKAWYAPGAKRLVEEQRRDGQWAGTYHPAVDTAFAILFLKRATVPVAAAITGR